MPHLELPQTLRRRRKLTVDDVHVGDESMRRRATLAAALGNAMEWYDFGIYAFIATTMSKVFFPVSGLALMATFGAFAVAFLFRPVGGAVFGRLGDRIGRQRVLATTMLLMAVATVSIGCIPSYSVIGGWAPALLLLARVLQGFSTGGEYSGSAIFLSEYAPDKRRGFTSAFIDAGSLSGSVLGAGLVTTLSILLPGDALVSWGWRVPFLLAAPFGIVGVYLRSRIEDTPAFTGQEQDGDETSRRTSLRALVTTYRRALLVCVGLTLVFNVTSYMLVGYVPTYLSSVLDVDATAGLLLIVVVLVIMACITPFIGLLSDKVGRRPVLLSGFIGLLVLSWPAFALIQMDNVIVRLGGLLIIGMLVLCFSATLPSALPALFPTAVRYTALSITFSLATSLFGGTTPLVTEWLHRLAVDRGLSWANDTPAFYLMVGAAVGIGVMAMYRETAGQPLEGSMPSVSDPSEAREVVAEYRDPTSDLAQSDWGVGHGRSRRQKGESGNDGDNHKCN